MLHLPEYLDNYRDFFAHIKASVYCIANMPVLCEFTHSITSLTAAQPGESDLLFDNAIMKLKHDVIEPWLPNNPVTWKAQYAGPPHLFSLPIGPMLLRKTWVHRASTLIFTPRALRS